MLALGCRNQHGMPGSLLALAPLLRHPAQTPKFAPHSCLSGAGGLLGAALFRHHKAIPSLLTLLLHCKGGEKAADQALSLLFPVFQVKAWFFHTRMSSEWHLQGAEGALPSRAPSARFPHDFLSVHRCWHPPQALMPGLQKHEVTMSLCPQPLPCP